MRRARFEEMAAEGVKYLEENREREGVNSTESGLQFRVINVATALSRHALTTFAYTTPVS